MDCLGCGWARKVSKWEKGGKAGIMGAANGTLWLLSLLNEWSAEGVSYPSFLWKYLGDDVEDVKIFKWTGRNGYVALCEPGFISFGGG